VKPATNSGRTTENTNEQRANKENAKSIEAVAKRWSKKHKGEGDAKSPESESATNGRERHTDYSQFHKGINPAGGIVFSVPFIGQ